MRKNLNGNEDDLGDFNIELDGDEDFFKDLPEESKKCSKKHVSANEKLLGFSENVKTRAKFRQIKAELQGFSELEGL